MKPKKLVFKNGIAETPIGDYKLIEYKDFYRVKFKHKESKYYSIHIWSDILKGRVIENSQEHYDNLIKSRCEKEKENFIPPLPKPPKLKTGNLGKKNENQEKD